MKKATVLSIVLCLVSLIVFLMYPDAKLIQEKEHVRQKRIVNIDTLFYENGFLIIGKANNEFKLANKKARNKNKDFHQITSFNDTVVLAKFEDYEDTEIYKKITFNYGFDTYKVPIYRGKLKDPDFKTNSNVRLFISRIKEGCKEGVNFAGHYTLVYWGCGTACQYGVIVDRRTGQIFDNFTSSLGVEFRADSNLIIFNAELENSNSKYLQLEHFTGVKIKVWKENEFKMLD